MERDFNIVKVNNIETLEAIDVNIEIDTMKYKSFEYFLPSLYFDHEVEIYKKIEKDICSKVSYGNNHNTSRRIICTYSPKDNESDWCMSLFHLLLGRKENKLIVYMRSLSFKYIVSDLAFLMHLALMFNAKLSLHIGSLHMENK